MIYLDSSVALAHVLAEDRVPPPSLWAETLTASRLLEYEVWNRIHARRLAESHGDAIRDVIGRVAFVELVPAVLARASEPFPVPVRTPDALHLSTLEFLRAQGQNVRLATYDSRLAAAAGRLRIPLLPL
jgi:predicted nucleic acid-binding protein